MFKQGDVVYYDDEHSNYGLCYILPNKPYTIKSVGDGYIKLQSVVTMNYDPKSFISEEKYKLSKKLCLK